jgi:hypothetical protein
LKFTTLEEFEGWGGSSVNWMLDDGTLDHFLEQIKKDNSLQFKSGAVRIPRRLIDAIIKRYGADYFGYELRPENNNHYHGHLLFSASLDKRRKATICGALSNAVSHFHR